MQKCLYLLCPTDCLETIINNTFQQENYFYTSLGNSFNANDETLNNLKCVIQKYHIRKICFVLSCDNKIIKDALHYQDFSDIKGLRDFYTEISKQQKKSVLNLKKNNLLPSFLSQYLNQKIQQLQLEFGDISIKITAKIYDRNENTFTPIYSNLYCLEKHQLN